MKKILFLIFCSMITTHLTCSNNEPDQLSAIKTANPLSNDIPKSVFSGLTSGSCWCNVRVKCPDCQKTWEAQNAGLKILQTRARRSSDFEAEYYNRLKILLAATAHDCLSDKNNSTRRRTKSF